MSNLLFLGFAVLFTAVGCTVIWLRQRKPSGVDTSVDAFKRELQALAPDRDITRRNPPDQDGRPG